ncbi:hypothetical protein JW905_13840 [bacterium]|nr:hypothetical protein [candidate division CSSED10-310 bacterium]
MPGHGLTGDQDGIIRSSGSVYELLLISLEHHDNDTNESAKLKYVLSKIENIPKLVTDDMAMRCPRVATYYGLVDEGASPRCMLETVPADSFFNSPRIDLSKDCPDSVEAFRGILLGKGDICVLTRTPHPFHSLRMRSMIHQCRGVKEILPIPCHRIKWPDERIFLEHDAKEWVTIDETEPFQKPLIFFTFLKLTSDTSSDLKDVLKRTIAAIDVNIRKKMPGTYTEIYLTFLDNQLLVKGEFSTFTEGATWSDRLRDCPGIIEVASQVCYSAQDVTWDVESGRWWFSYPVLDGHWHHEPDDHRMLCGLLLKVRAGEAGLVGGQLKEFFKFESTDSKISVKYTGRSKGYWDLFCYLETISVFDVLRIVVTKLLNSPSIIETRILPNLQIPHATDPSLSVFATDKQEEYPIQPRFMPEVTNKINLKFDECTLPLNGHIDPLVARSYNLRFDLQLLLSKVRQLYAAWSGRVRFSTTPITFDSLIEELTELINQLCKQISRNELTADAIHLLDISSKRAEVCNQIYMTMVEVYHELSEGTQVTSINDPMMNYGERSGILQLVHQTAGRLMAEYCGKFQYSSQLEKYKDSIRMRNHLPSSFWKGVVASTTGHDFKVHTKWQLLYVPSGIKISVHDLLFFVGHEAAHFILANAREYSRFFDFLFRISQNEEHRNHKKHDPRLLDRLINSCITQLKKWILLSHCKDLSSASGDFSNSSMHDNLDEIYEYVLEKKGIYRKYRQQWEMRLNRMCEEFLIDLMSNLICSPFFSLAIARNYYSPLHYPPVNSGSTRTASGATEQYKPSSHRLPVAIRIKLGLHVCSSLKLDQAWKNPLLRQYELIEAIETKLANRFNPEYPGTRCQELHYMDRVYLTTVMARCFTESKDFALEMEKTMQLLLRPCPLFFPAPDNEKDDDPRSSRAIHDQCRRIAERISYDCEVVTDAQAKFITAASLVEDDNGKRILARPFFPAGRVCHSVIYSKQQGGRRNISQTH